MSSSATKISQFIDIAKHHDQATPKPDPKFLISTNPYTIGLALVLHHMLCPASDLQTVRPGIHKDNYADDTYTL